MQLRYMDIFKDFRCTGGECRDNCCRMGWDIEIDPETARFWEELDSPLGERLRGAVYEEDGCRYMGQEGGCPFLNSEGLCSVQLELGEGHISEICREHPRFYEWFGDYKEAGVGLCCEEAARLICAHPGALEFFSCEIDEEPDGLEFDGELLKAMLYFRQGLILLMQDRHLGLDERCGAVLSLAGKMGPVLEGESYKELSLIGQDLAKAHIREAVAWGFGSAYAPSEDQWRRFRELMMGMEYLGGTVPGLLGSRGPEELFAARGEFLERYGDRIFELEHIGVYFLFRYMIKAVRDRDTAGHAAEAVFFVRAAEMLLTAEYLSAGELPGEERRAELFKELSKEIEYSPDNMERIYEALGGGEL